MWRAPREEKRLKIVRRRGATEWTLVGWYSNLVAIFFSPNIGLNYMIFNNVRSLMMMTMMSMSHQPHGHQSFVDCHPIYFCKMLRASTVSIK